MPDETSDVHADPPAANATDAADGVAEDPTPDLRLPSLFRRRRRRPTPEPVLSSPNPASTPAPAEVAVGSTSTRVPVRGTAVLAGAGAALVSVALGWLVLQGCAGLRGTSSCGGGPGLLALLVLFLVAVVTGRTILAVTAAPNPGATALLGTALAAVVSLVVGGSLSGWVAAVVLVLLGAAGYGLAQWLTSTFTEPGDRPR